MKTIIRKKYVQRIWWVCMLLFLSLANGMHSQAKTKTMKLGTSLSVARSDASYTSTDTDILYVDSQGRVTAKKMGTAEIRIKRDGEVTKKKIRVVANGRKKSHVNVSTGEIEIYGNVVSYDADDQTAEGMKYNLQIDIFNQGTSTASEVVVKGMLGEKQLSLTIDKLRADESRKTVLSGYTTSTQGQLKLTKLLVYSRDMYTEYDYETQETSLHYAEPDTTPPEISGFVGKNSYNWDQKKHQMPYQVIYSGEQDQADFFKYVTAEDDRGGKVELKVDTSKVNFRKEGNYTITYTATDRAGNRSKAKARIGVRKQKTVDQYADIVLKTIIKDSWSDTHKLQAIYNYVRGHVAYVGYSSKESWEQEAIHGIRTGYGDCFTYYAMARALLTRAGLPNIEITRVRGAGHHWWNMVYTKNGWYHYDCGPRRWGGRFCLVTDKQLKKYSREHENVYIWNYKLKPKTSKKAISSIY